LFSSPLGALALVVGIGAVGGFLLDWHRHTCESCGRRWSHLGAFNLGDEDSHTCSRCGEVQWFKDGARHVLHESANVELPSPAEPPHMAQPQWQPVTPQPLPVAGYPQPYVAPYPYAAPPQSSLYPPYMTPQPQAMPPAAYPVLPAQTPSDVAMHALARPSHPSRAYAPRVSAPQPSYPPPRRRLV
jgi:hypothetical protein